ncbi:MAG: PQQ-dependent sugar dehydrogenase [Gammaproteobacteria bacterium]|nr:PQQ-dependent sugar dehydrogenase [Gammaproteobacteria bacterium]
MNFSISMKLGLLIGLLAVGSDHSHAGSIVPADFALEQIITGGQLSGAPLAARHAGDGSGRLFIVEQSGAIRIWDGSTVLATPFINLGGGGGLNITSGGGERGLLGLDFHPDFASNGLFYVNYTAANASPFTTGTTVVAEFQVSAGNANVADATSQRVLLTVTQDFANHNGGDIHFGPDGYLYIGMGDGGSGNDPCNRSQTLDPASLVPPGACGSGASLNDSLALLGKMLRIDVDNTTPPGSNQLCAADPDGSAEYAIPNDNPFLGSDPDNACDEVWSYGLRNPFRFSFDRQTGDMLIGDVGQNVWEEVDFEPFDTMGGLNYGWDPCEGNNATGTTNPCTFPSELAILEYQHTGGRCSIEGGYRYRGPVSSLQGLYSYGDFCTGEIWLAEEVSPGVWQSEIATNTGVNFGFGLVAFGEDEQGNVYAIDQTQGIWRFTAPLQEVFFVDGFEDLQ